MANINTGPAAVDTGATTITPIGPLDRTPGPVPAASDPGIPTAPPVYNRPVDRAPEPVEPGPGLGTTPGAVPAAPIPVFEIPVQEPVPTGAGNSVTVATPVYIQVLSDGTLITEHTMALNFLGTGVTVAANGSTANITITAGGSSYTNSNVVTLMSGFGSNTISTTGNITGGYILGNGSQLTGIAANYSNSNVVSLMSAFGSNSISTTGNITAGYISAPDGNGSVLINSGGFIGAAAGFNFSSNTLFAPSISATGAANTGINAIYGGVAGYVVLGSSVMTQFTGNVNAYSQINFQNISSGNRASGDYIVTADNGTDSTYYLDLGLAGSNHDDPAFFGDTATKNDGYLYVNGASQAGPGGGVGNLIVGSTNGTIKMFVGNTAQANVIATVSATGVSVAGNITIGNLSSFDASNTNFTGAIAGNVLTVTGAVDGSIAWGQTLYGTGVAANTVIKGQLTFSSANAGGNGTYSLNQTQTVSARTMYVDSLYMDGDIKLSADHGIYVRDAHDPYLYDNLIGISEVDATIFIGSVNTNGVTIDNSKEYKVDSAINPGTYMAVAKVDANDNVILGSGNANTTQIKVGGLGAGYAMKFQNGGEALLPTGLRIGDNTNSSIFAAPLEVGSILGAAANNQSSPAGVGLSTYRGTGTVIANDEWGSYLYGSRFRGTINSPLPTKNNDWLMEFGATSFDGTNNNGGGEMAFRVDGTVTSSANPSRWELYVTPAGANSQTLGLKVDSTLAVTAYGNINTSGNTSATGNVTGGNITTAGLISATANVTGGNLRTGGLVSATGNITGNFFIGNGSQLTGITAVSSYGNANVVANLAALGANPISTTSNITGGNILFGSGVVSGTGNIYGNNISLTGNTTSGNLLTGGLVSATGNITGGNVLTVGIMSSTGNATHGNILTAGLVSATANITGGNILTVGVMSSTGNATHGNVLTAGQLSSTGNVTAGGITINGTGVVTGNFQVQGNLTYNNLTNITTSNLVFYLANTTTGISANGAGIAVGNTSEATFLYNQPVQLWSSNIGISAVGNIIGGNLRTAGLITATGNVQGGNILTGGLISATSSITSAANVTGGNILTAGLITATGTITSAANITGGNILTAGLISATSTITSAANITGGNILTAGQVSATGNVSGSFFIGNGSQLTGVAASYGNANVVANVAALGSNPVSTTGNITGGNLLFGAGVVSGTGNIFASTISITGNTISGNVTTGGLVTATGNITGGNILTAGVMSSTGNATHGNILTAGLVSATANITGGNVLTAGLVSATGSLTIANANADIGTVVANSTYNLGTGVTSLGLTKNVNIGTAGAASSNTIITIGTTLGTGNVTFPAGTTVAIANTGSLALSAVGNITGGNVLTGGIMSSTGNALHGNILTGGLISAAGTITTTANITGGNLLFGAGVVSGTGNIFASTISLTGNTTSGNLLTGGLVSATANVTGGNVTTGGLVSAAANVTGGNLITAGLITATGNITSVANIAGGNILTAGIMSSTGNATHGNILTAGLTSVTGNITGGNLTTGGLVVATGNITGGNLITGGLISATGNITAVANIAGGNILTAGIMSSTGNATHGNILTAGLTSVTGNITGGNILTSGLISATSGLVANVIAPTTATPANGAGYIGMPVSSITGTGTLTIVDAGKLVYITGASQTVTIPANGSVAFPIGTAVTFIAGPASSATSIAITTDTMYLAGTGTTGTRTLAANAMATAVKVASTTWYINGTGLS